MRINKQMGECYVIIHSACSNGAIAQKPAGKMLQFPIIQSITGIIIIDDAWSETTACDRLHVGCFLIFPIRYGQKCLLVFGGDVNPKDPVYNEMVNKNS